MSPQKTIDQSLATYLAARLDFWEAQHYTRNASRRARRTAKRQAARAFRRTARAQIDIIVHDE